MRKIVAYCAVVLLGIVLPGAVPAASAQGNADGGPHGPSTQGATTIVTVEPKGSGSVVLFVSDPAFRLFWRATTPLLLNALMYGTSAGLGGRN